MTNIIYFIILFAFLMGDAATTYYGVEYLGLTELNSMMAVVVDNRAWELLFFIKVLQLGFFYMLFDVMDKLNKKPDNNSNFIIYFFRMSILLIAGFVVISNLLSFQL